MGVEFYPEMCALIFVETIMKNDLGLEAEGWGNKWRNEK